MGSASDWHFRLQMTSWTLPLQASSSARLRARTRPPTRQLIRRYTEFRLLTHGRDNWLMKRSKRFQPSAQTRVCCRKLPVSSLQEDREAAIFLTESSVIAKHGE